MKLEEVVNKLAKLSILLKLQETSNAQFNIDIRRFVDKFVEDNK